MCVLIAFALLHERQQYIIIIIRIISAPSRFSGFNVCVCCMSVCTRLSYSRMLRCERQRHRQSRNSRDASAHTLAQSPRVHKYAGRVRRHKHTQHTHTQTNEHTQHMDYGSVKLWIATRLSPLRAFKYAHIDVLTVRCRQTHAQAVVSLGRHRRCRRSIVVTHAEIDMNKRGILSKTRPCYRIRF